MAALLYPASGVGLHGVVTGRPNPRYQRAVGLGIESGVGKHWAITGDTSGAIRDRVMIKLTPSSPESPFRNGEVWVLRLPDGYKAWAGWSDAQGWYTARGLEIGVSYVALGIDPYREHKATGAGPVVAVHEDTL